MHLFGKCEILLEIKEFAPRYTFPVRLRRSAGDSLTPGAGTGGGEGGEITGGPRTPQQIAAQKRLQQTQAQVDEVVDIMKTNVEKVLERDSKLSELDDRAGKALSSLLFC